MTPAVFAVLICVLAPHAALAHGGNLHPGSPETKNYIRTRVANCSSWVLSDATVNGTLAAAAVAAGAVPAPANVEGVVTLWQFLYSNCSLAPGQQPSAAVAFNVTVTRGGLPLSNITLDGMVVTDTCASGIGQPYYLNMSATPVNNKYNLLWFHNYTLGPSGRVEGNGANEGPVVTAAPNSTASNSSGSNGTSSSSNSTANSSTSSGTVGVAVPRRALRQYGDSATTTAGGMSDMSDMGDMSHMDHMGHMHHMGGMMTQQPEGAAAGLAAAQAETQAARAVLLVDTISGVALSCCDLVPAGPPDTNWTATLDGMGTPCPGNSD